MSWFNVLKNTNVPKEWARPTPEQKKISDTNIESMKELDSLYSENENADLSDYRQRRRIFIDEEWKPLVKEMAQQVIDYFKGDIPIDTWVDTKSPVELRENFYHWFFQIHTDDTIENIETEGKLDPSRKLTTLQLLEVAGNVCSMWGVNSERIALFDLWDEYNKLLDIYKKAADEAVAEIREREEQDKEKEWEKTLSVARQWGIKPTWHVEQNKDSEGLKEQINQRHEQTTRKKRKLGSVPRKARKRTKPSSRQDEDFTEENR